MTDLIRRTLTRVLLHVLPAAEGPRRRRLALVLAADYGIDLDQHVRGAVA
ncbi:hypothetical protein [Streptomyces sp. NPDC102360]